MMYNTPYAMIGFQPLTREPTPVWCYLFKSETDGLLSSLSLHSGTSRLFNLPEQLCIEWIPAQVEVEDAWYLTHSS